MTSRFMGRVQGTPPEWICNARTEHVVGDNLPELKTKGALKQCHCLDCMLAMDARLVAGPPQPTVQYSADQLEDQGLVGVYTRKPEFYIPCHECQKGIPVTDAAHVAAVRSGESTLYHYDCHPEKLEGVVSPYVLVSVDGQESQNAEAEASSESLRREDGGGAEEERLQGDLGGEGPGDDDG